MACLVGFMYRLLHIEIIRLLKKKRTDPEFSPPEINMLDIYKLDPFMLPEFSEINSDEQVWNFFCEPNYKYANSKRANRIAGNGYWNVTGKTIRVKDKFGKVIGSKKTLVYYKRVASRKVKTGWVMNEFSVEDSSRYKMDFVFCYIEKNPNSKFNVSTPDDDEHQPSQSLVSDSEMYATEKTSTEVELQQPSSQPLRKNFLEMESEVQSHYNLVPGTGNHFLPKNYCMEEPQLLSDQTLGLDPKNNFADNASPMEIESHPLSDHSLFRDDQSNHFVPINSSKNDSALIPSSMVESQLLSNQNLVFDSSRTHLTPNASLMVAHDQLLSNHNVFSDPGNHFAPNTLVRTSMSCGRFSTKYFAGALFGSNHSSVYAPQPRPIHPEHGSSFTHSNGFCNSSTFPSSQFHGELEDVHIAQRTLQDAHPDQATGQTLPADTDIDDIDAFVDELIVDIPVAPN